MDTAHIREGIRKMRFSTILDRWDSGEMTQETAAELLGMSVRSFQRWRERYEADGEAGLVDRRGAPSPRRAPEEEVERMLGLYRDKYADFTVRHFHEQLTKRHNYTLGYTVTKLCLHRAGLVRPAPKRSAHRKKRPRRPMRGMMLHQDGSRHVWVEGRPSMDLIVTMDDATSEIYSMILVEEEGTASTFEALREVIGERGLFCALYTDRGSHYIAEHNARFAVDPEQEGSAFVPDAKEMWREILCVVEERTVAGDNTVAWNGRRLQLPESRLRPHFVRAQVAGARVPRRSLRCVARPASARRLRRRGSPPRPDCAQVWRRARGRQGQALSGALARILDRPCARRQFRCAGRDEETAAQPNKETAQTQPGDDRRSILLSSRAVRGFRPASNINPKTPHHALQKHDRLTSYGHRRPILTAILKEGRDDFFAGGFPNQRKHDSRWGWRSWRRFCLA